MTEGEKVCTYHVFGNSVSQSTMFSFGLTTSEVDLKQNYSAKIRFHHCKVVHIIYTIFYIYNVNLQPRVRSPVVTEKCSTLLERSL